MVTSQPSLLRVLNVQLESVIIGKYHNNLKDAINLIKLTFNSSKEIDKKNYDLHIVYCLKNITKCPYCKVQCDMKDLQ